jgi:hypothetical protein
LSFLHCRTNDDRFPLSLWEGWFCPTLGVSIPVLIPCSEITSRHVKLSRCLHRFRIGWFTVWVEFWFWWVIELRSTRLRRSTTGKERGDREIKDYVVLQKPQEQSDRLPPSGSSHVHTTGQLTCTCDSRESWTRCPELDIDRSLGSSM